jgi:hypothetical protein
MRPDVPGQIMAALNRKPSWIRKRNVIKSAVTFQNKRFHFLVCVGCVSLRFCALGVHGISPKLTTENSV